MTITFKNLFYLVLILVFSLNAINSQKLITFSGVDIEYIYGSSSTNYILTFQLPSGYTQSNIWLGFGLNKNGDMDEASVVVCTSDVKHYYNEGYRPPVLFDTSNPLLGLSNTSVVFNQNTMICRFSRDNSNSDQRYFDISKNNPYILIAYGKLNSGALVKHDYRSGSSNSYALNSILTTTTSAQSTSMTSSFAGPAYGLYQQGNFKFSWIYNQNQTDFIFTINVAGASNVYGAIGFSNDQKMGDDGVVYCTNSANIVSQAYNQGKNPRLLDSNNPSIGITNFNVKMDGSNLVCSFTRANRLVNTPDYFDLNNKYYVLLARGPASGNNIQIHSEKSFSSSMIDFRVNSSLTDAQRNNDKVKAHGAIMVIAWIFCASTGILFARYYKFIFPTVKWFNLQFWFNIHRPVMIFVPILSIIAFIVILADLGWKWVDIESKVGFAHSIFGIVVIGLSVIQIPMAFVRPAPTAPRRYIFNYAHRSVGLSAFFLSIIALFLGVCVPRANIGKNGWGIMIGWLLWVIVLPLTIELLQNFVFKKRIDSYQINSTTDPTAGMSSKALKQFEIIKSILLVFHLIAALAFTVALIVFIAKEEGSSKS